MKFGGAGATIVMEACTDDMAWIDWTHAVIKSCSSRKRTWSVNMNHTSSKPAVPPAGCGSGVVAQISQVISDAYSRRLSLWLTSSQQLLLKAPSKTPSKTPEQTCFSAVSRIRSQGKDICEHLVHGYLHRLQNGCGDGSGHADGDVEGDVEDTHTAQRNASLAQIVATAEVNLGAEFNAPEQVLASIFPAWASSETGPLSARWIMQGLVEVLDDWKLPAEIENLILTTFRDHVALHWGDVCHAVREELGRQGLLQWARQTELDPDAHASQQSPAPASLASKLTDRSTHDLLAQWPVAFDRLCQGRAFGEVGLQALAFASAAWDHQALEPSCAVRDITTSLFIAGGIQAEDLSREAFCRVSMAETLATFLVEDWCLGAPVRQLMAPWRTTLYRFALVGPALLDDPQNPVWKLFDNFQSLAELLPDRVEQDRDLTRSVSAYLAGCSVGDDLTSAIQSLTSLVEKYCHNRKRRVNNVVRRQVNAMRGRERWIMARHDAEQCVSMLLAGREVYPAIKCLLSGLWVDVLTLLALRNGLHSQAWRVAEKTARALTVLGGVRQKTVATDRREMQAISKNLEKGLSMIGAGQSEFSSVAKILRAAQCHHVGEGGPESLQILVNESDALLLRNAAKERQDELGLVSIAGIGAQRETAVKELCALPTPTRVRLGTSREKRYQRVQWCWCSVKTGHCLLVDHAGKSVGIRSLLEAADAYISGRLLPDSAPMKPAYQRFLETWVAKLEEAKNH